MPLRGLRRSPLFAAVAILSLALGIGANTAIFTLIDQILLRKLPVRDPEELVMLFQRGNHNGSNMGGRMHSYPIYQDYQQKGQPLSQVICRRLVAASVAIDNQTERVSAEMVSGNYFDMLGVRPAAGRVLHSEEDDQVYNGHPVVVLSHDYWVSRFARSPGVIGKKIQINNYPMTIVGVSAAGFAGIDPALSPQIRVPILMKPVMLPEWGWMRADDRRARWVQVFARLKPGQTVESAAAPMQGLFTQIRRYEATLPAAKDWSAYDKEQFLKGTLHVEKADIGYSNLRNDFSTALIVLMCMVGLVLLISCANVANLLIARGFMRQREIAVRLSLGATRGRLVRQLLVESLVLSAIGGLTGVFVAIALTRGLLALIPSDSNPLLIQAAPDLRILGFTFALTLVTGIVFGLLPALRASRPDPWTTLKDTVGTLAGSGGSLFLRKGLVTAQVALSFLLLFGAGLFVRSLQNLRTTDPGVVLDNLVTFQLSPALNGYTDERGSQFYRDLLQNLRSAPGVKSAGQAAVSILSGDEWDSSMSVEGHKAADGEDMQAFMNALSPGYFQTMQIPVLEGRDFRESDQQQPVRRLGARYAAGRHRQPEIRAALLQGREPAWQAARLWRRARHQAQHRDHRRRRRLALRRAARGRPSPGVHPELGSWQQRDLHANGHCVCWRLQPDPQRGPAAGFGDAGLQPQDAGVAARRDAAQRPSGRAAVGRIRAAGHGAGVGRSVRRDGLRRRAAPQGARHPPRARRAAVDAGLDGDEGSAAAAGHWPRGWHSVGDGAGPVRVLAAVRHRGARSLHCRVDGGAAHRRVGGWPA